MSSRTAARLAPLALLAVLLGPGLSPARADDETPAEALVTRLFDVGALTSGRPEFIRAVSMSAEPGLEEESPLFGAECEEPVYPFGQVDELIELMKTHVRPEAWETVLGADVRSCGEGTLVVRCFPDVVDEVAGYLGALQRRSMRRVAVDVETFRLTSQEIRALLVEDGSILADAGRLEALRGGERAGPSITLAAYERHRATAFSGKQRAYVADYDVEVAWGSKIADPIVEVDNTGLVAEMRSILDPEGRSVLLMLGAALSRLRGVDTSDTGEGALVELPQHAVANVNSRVEIPVGAWALLEGETAEAGDASWVFAVRVSALPLADLAETARGVTLAAAGAEPSRTMELRWYDVAMLGISVQSRLGEDIFLTPSNFTPPAPPELPDPAPVFPQEAIVELLRQSIVPASWELKGAAIEMRGGYLYVRNAPRVHEAIASQLRALRQAFVWSALTTAELVDVPEALGRRLLAAPDRVVSAEDRAALDAAVASGQATRLGTARVVTASGGRNAVTTGRRIAYVGDYEVEIAQESAIANPVIERCLSGTGLDVHPRLTVCGQATDTVLRYVHSDVREPMRKVRTPHGELAVPEMDIFQLRAALEVPLGKTMVVGGSGADGRRRLLLVGTHHPEAGRVVAR